MNCTAVISDHAMCAYFQRSHLARVLLILWICCSASAFAQGTGQATSSPSGIGATHLLGFEDTKRNAKGILSIQDDALQFQMNGRPPVQVKTASIREVFLGAQSQQVGGLPMTLGKTAAPFGSGRVVSLFAHKKYDTVTVEYVDTNGAVHGAIFLLRKGQGDVLGNELAAKGAHVSVAKDEPGQQTARGRVE